jgi:WD40 repeat protein
MFARVVGGNHLFSFFHTISLKPSHSLQVWKLSSGKCLRKLDPAHAKGITSLAFSRDSLQLATASFDGTARLHGIKAGRVLKVGPR